MRLLQDKRDIDTVVSALIAQVTAHEEPGGFTLFIRYDKEGRVQVSPFVYCESGTHTPRFITGIGPEFLLSTEVTVKNLRPLLYEYVTSDEVADKLTLFGGFTQWVGFGGWVDNDHLIIDPVLGFFTSERALTTGRIFNQTAVYDAREGKDLPVK